jgi:BirA family biotin operon repressor/biotin-[acetyl-CoA-carboxylase] ligase
VGTNTPRAPLNQSVISSELSQYWRVSVVELTTSTQEDLLRNLALGNAKNGDVVVAEFQSAGRGRLDRKFDAAHSSALLFSFYFQPKREKKDWGFLTLLAGMAVTRALNSAVQANYPVMLKWPNDLLIGDLKVGGIIASLQSEGVVIGVGVNVEMDQSQLPVPTATSLLLAGSSELDRNTLLVKILNEIEQVFTSWDNGEIYVDRYREMSATLGKVVQITLPNGQSIQSRALDVDASGALSLENGDRITVGDVIHLR